MKKLFSTFLLIGLLFPTITEAGVNRPKKSRCKGSGGVIGCRILKKPKKCSIKKPCIPRGYYRKDPIKYIPMR
tara:strand:- start:1487 stop:1705 length:219 start_codon:yes stop_codon:yes gene_type:complete